MGKEELMRAWLPHVRAVVEQYYLYVGTPLPKTRIFQVRHPDPLWERIRTFVRNLAGLPLWINRDLSLTAFGSRQNQRVWEHAFQTGKTPQGVQVLASPLSIKDLLADA